MKKVLILDAPNKHSKVVCSIIRDYGVEVELFAVCDKGGTCTNGRLAEGLVYGLFGCFDIINISLGLPSMSKEVSDLIDKLVDKGIKIVCASGNNSRCYPSMHPKTISVGAIDENGEITSYTVEGSYDVLELGTYEYKGKLWSGTSFACARYSGKLASE